jgi:hypothetical protein
MSYNSNGYDVRADNIRRITEQYYEPENLAKCYKSVWSRYIYPLYGISYQSYLKYLKRRKRSRNKPDDRQLRLFD